MQTTPLLKVKKAEGHVTTMVLIGRKVQVLHQQPKAINRTIQNLYFGKLFIFYIVCHYFSTNTDTK